MIKLFRYCLFRGIALINTILLWPITIHHSRARNDWQIWIRTVLDHTSYYKHLTELRVVGVKTVWFFVGHSCDLLFAVQYTSIISLTNWITYLHWVNCDCESRVIPSHLCVLYFFLCSSLMSSSNTNHSQHNHEQQEPHANHNDDSYSMTCIK